RLGDERGAIRGRELVEQQHLDRDATPGKLLLVEEDVREPARAEQPHEGVPGQLGRCRRGSAHQSSSSRSSTPPPRSTTVPRITGVGSPPRSFCVSPLGSTIVVPLRECRSVTTTVPPSRAMRTCEREMSWSPLERVTRSE